MKESESSHAPSASLPSPDLPAPEKRKGTGKRGEAAQLAPEKSVKPGSESIAHPASDNTARRVLARVVETMGGTQRPGQQQMVDEIVATLKARDHLMVQAGTGTGKSLGYLVPLLTRCVEGEMRALVSTATLALQRQILTKDAPVALRALREEMGRSARIALMKGWNNYLCLHRLQGGYPSEGTLFDMPGEEKPGEASGLGREIQRVREWAQTTSSGDRDDLVPGVSDRAWRQVSVSKRECLGRHCPHIDDCFPQEARKQAASADLVVTNHSLLGIDALGANELFPDIDAVVIDEAHELAERVREQASLALSATGVLRVARRVRTHVGCDVDALEEAAEGLCAALAQCEDGLMPTRPDFLCAAMSSVDTAARDVYTQVEELPKDTDAASKTLVKAALDELFDALAAWGRPVEEMITWVSRNLDDGREELLMAPLHVAPALGLRALGDRPAVLTSATLSLGGSFDAVAYENGLMISEVPWRGVDVGSPFDAASQGIVYVAEHLPDPIASGSTPQALQELCELVEASGGGALVLFSSWKGAQAGAEALRERTSCEVLLQGEDSVSTLVQTFRESRDSVLVGTMSLWQGVDVVGDSCRLVVIDRIPFPHPNNPVVQARTRDAHRRGVNGFWAVSVTHAALMMAQGAGRLLRSHTDRGVVAILDRRVVTKSYGAFIMNSLPPLWPTRDPQVVRGALRRLNDSAH